MLLPLINVKETIECNFSVIFGNKVIFMFVQSIFVKFSAIFRPNESIRPNEFRPSGLSVK
jgi:hypothetical protein